MLADANVLLLPAVILAAGTVCGNLAKLVHLPSVTGQIVAGVLMGASVFGVLTEENLHSLRPLVDFAVGLMAVAVGSHLNFSRLRVARRRLMMRLLLESILTPLIVYGGLILFTDIASSTALLLATIAVSTAPATVLAIVKETTSKGAFVTTLLAAVALNNLACIILFELARTIARTAVAPATSASHLSQPGGSAGRYRPKPADGLWCRSSVDYCNTSRRPHRSIVGAVIDRHPADHGADRVPWIVCVAGVPVSGNDPDQSVARQGRDRPSGFRQFRKRYFRRLLQGRRHGTEFRFPGDGRYAGSNRICGPPCRQGGRGSSGDETCRCDTAVSPLDRTFPDTTGRPGGRIDVTGDRRPCICVDSGIVSRRCAGHGAVINETTGPILTRMGLKQSGDFGRDRARVLDFLSEHNITTELKRPDKPTAIRQLAELTVNAHKLSIEVDTLFDAVMDGERMSSTCVGEGLALPHARLDVGQKIIGYGDQSQWAFAGNAGSPARTLHGNDHYANIVVRTSPGRSADSSRIHRTRPVHSTATLPYRVAGACRRTAAPGSTVRRLELLPGRRGTVGPNGQFGGRKQMQHNTTMSRPARNPSATDELQTRRNVLRFGMSSLVGLRCLTGASAGACPQLQDSENDHLLLGFSTYGMKTLTTESAISHIARIGFDSAEITVWPDWDAAPGNMTVERRQTIKTQLADSGLRLTSLMEHITPSEKDTQHAAQRTRLAGVFELAADLCPAQRPLVQTVLGGGQWEKKRELLRDRVGDWLDLATAHKTVLAIKPHRGGVVSRPEEAVWLIEQLGQSRYLRIVYDYSHYAYRDMLLADTVRTALPYLAHVAVKDAVKEGNRIVFKLPGQAGTIPYAKLLKLLFDGGYRGDISCEVSSMVWNKPGYAPVAAAEACYRSLAKAFVEADVRRPA